MQQTLPVQANESENIYRDLLESTKAIPWKIDWASQRYVYVGPQIEQLLGWKAEDWGTVQDWANRIHPEDRDQVVSRCIELSLAGIDHEADYRAQTVDDQFIWVRETVRVLRNPDGSPQALVGFLFDIRERKAAEEKILQLQQELERLSYKDALTHIANRRSFDTTFAQIWKQACETQAPLSLILLDIDFFKQLNDYHGHLYGDECLIQIAALLSQACDKPSDLVARYGGEEFVVLLPNVQVHVAQQVAERFRSLLAQKRIPHGQSPLGQHVTASMGVGSVTPLATLDPQAFVCAVDRLLYQAKNKGRDQVIAQPLSLEHPALSPSLAL